MRIRWVAAIAAAGIVALLAGCAGQIGAFSTSSLVVAPPTASAETVTLRMTATTAAMDQALGRALDLLAAPRYFDDGWRKELVDATTAVDAGYRQLTELIPPAEQRAARDAVAQALDGCKNLTALVQQGINNLDKAPFDELAGRAEFCRGQLAAAPPAPVAVEIAVQTAPQPGEAAQSTPRLTVIRNANLRAGPSATSSRVSTAAQGDQFTITGRSEKGDWLRVTNDRVKEAWIAAFLGTVEGDLQRIPVTP